MKSLCVIPSRYGSVRFKGKPLIDICGKPLIQRVYESAAAVRRFDEIIVTTDDERIYEAVCGFNGKVVMSPSTLQTGTDRIAYVLRPWDSW